MSTFYRLLGLQMNIYRNTHLVVKPDIGKSHPHQPLKHGHFQVEVLSKIIYCGTGA